jgi:hypothetical protein
MSYEVIDARDVERFMIADEFLFREMTVPHPILNDKFDPELSQFQFKVICSHHAEALER